MKNTHTKTSKPDYELRRNTLTIRLKDSEHKAISNEAWYRRMSMSGWVREVAINELIKTRKFTK